MYGAILGDMIGAPMEFDRGDKSKEFELFTSESQFTDDSVMTVAVAEALLKAGPHPEREETLALLVKSMKKWGRKIPNAGYGGRFFTWLFSNTTEPYGSCGNGSAMRCSAAGWLYDTMEETRRVAAMTAEVTHNHPEGIKAAEATAAAIFMARNGAEKSEIKAYIESEFHYDLSRTLDEIRPGYYHIEIAQKTVPEAITAFLEGESFEDTVRNAISLGGDTDTLAAIAGAIAEAYFGIPVNLKAICLNRITSEMADVIGEFDERLGRNSHEAENRTSYVELGLKMVPIEEIKESFDYDTLKQ